MMELQKERAASSALLGAASEIRARKTSLDETLRLKERDAALAKEIANQLELLLRPTLQECESGKLTGEQMLQLLVKSLRGTLNYSRSLTESSSGEVRHVRGYIEGLGSCADLISEMGNSLLREAERVEALAQSDDDIDKRRSVGERPETLRVKRKAAALREKSVDDDPDSSKVE